jgi:hypothetical protein
MLKFNRDLDLRNPFLIRHVDNIIFEIFLTKKCWFNIFPFKKELKTYNIDLLHSKNSNSNKDLITTKNDIRNMSEYSVKNNQTKKFMRQVHFNFKRYSLYCFTIELFAVLSIVIRTFKLFADELQVYWTIRIVKNLGDKTHLARSKLLRRLPYSLGGLHYHQKNNSL